MTVTVTSKDLAQPSLHVYDIGAGDQDEQRTGMEYCAQPVEKGDAGGGQGAVMQRLRGTFLTFAVVASMLPLSGCTKVISWQEEVALNTGDILVVQREATYVRAGAPGNPLDIGWSLKRGGEIQFTWKERRYMFKEHNVPLVLAISPRGTPVLVINAAAGSWDARHKLGCRTPHYVHFVPDASGANWTWPDKVEPWLYGMRANMLRDIPEPNNVRPRYGWQDVRQINERLRVPEYERLIDPNYTSDSCKEGP